MHTPRSIIKFSSLICSAKTLHRAISTISPTSTLQVKGPSLSFIQPIVEDQIHFQISETVLNITPTSHHQPKIICHRGRCDIYPQNTIQSITQGLLTSDLVQFDVMLTKDEEVIVFHDRFLGEITNVCELQSFQNRKTINDLNQFGQIPHPQWWTKQFTLQEVKKLSVKQKHSTRPQKYNQNFSIPTFEQVIKRCLEIKQRDPSNNAGILIEIKTQRQNFNAAPRDKILLQKINEVLQKYGLNTAEKRQSMNFPIIVQSFNHEVIQIFHSICPQLPLTHLYYQEDQNVSQQYIANHRTQSSIGVAISTKHLTHEFIEACHRMKYEIFYWSVRDDHPQIPLGCNSYQEFYQRLKLMKLDGIITDFANNCKQAIKGLVA